MLPLSLRSRSLRGVDIAARNRDRKNCAVNITTGADFSCTGCGSVESAAAQSQIASRIFSIRAVESGEKGRRSARYWNRKHCPSIINAASLSGSVEITSDQYQTGTRACPIHAVEAGEESDFAACRWH